MKTLVFSATLSLGFLAHSISYGAELYPDQNLKTEVEVDNTNPDCPLARSLRAQENGGSGRSNIIQIYQSLAECKKAVDELLQITVLDANKNPKLYYKNARCDEYVPLDKCPAAEVTVEPTVPCLAVSVMLVSKRMAVEEFPVYTFAGVSCLAASVQNPVLQKCRDYLSELKDEDEKFTGECRVVNG